MGNENVVRIGKMLGDSTRVALLDALFDCRAYTVTELSRHVGVAQSTTSEHLAKMLDAGLLTIEAQGRHRYYRLRSAEVAETLEKLFELGHSGPVRRAAPVPGAMVYARTCYDHLAGTLAVALTDHFFSTGILADSDNGMGMAPEGVERMAAFGLRTVTERSRRPTVRTCLDWSERRHHLAGAMPAELLDIMFDRRWFRRQRSSRGLDLTDAGRAGLAEAFDFDAP